MSIHSEDVVIHAISHKIRREIMELLKEGSKTFSELLNHFDISTGKLNYHLNQIKGFIRKDPKKNYNITHLGLKALEILEAIRKEFTEKERPLLKEAFISQKDSAKPFILQGINLGIGGLIFFVSITIFLFVVFLMDPNAPIFVLPIIIVMLLGEIFGLTWVIRIRTSAPAFIERFNRHLRESES